MRVVKNYEYQKIFEHLSSARRFGIELGLGKTKEALKALGYPDRAFETIQIGGTNGKGSTCLMLASLLQSKGYRVGVFTSPHIERFNERFVVNGVEATKQQIVNAYKNIRDCCKQELTFFEWSTLIALVIFENTGCEKVILEVGLGGRLDATTATKRAGVVVTGVDFDHQEYLGDTLSQIAKEKAAIAIPGKPALIGCTGQKQAVKIVRDEMLRLGATPVVILGSELPDGLPNGWNQAKRQNASCALRAAELFGTRLNQSNAIGTIGKVILPGRQENIVLGDTTYILDGAHNPGAAQILADECEDIDAVIVGINNDKEISKILKILSPIGRDWIVTASSSERAARPESLAQHLGELGIKANKVENVSLAIEQTSHFSKVLICGSLYMVGEARTELKKKWNSKKTEVID